MGVEDQVAGPVAVGALPEVDEAEDLLGLFALAQIGVGVAEGLALGILGQEGEDAGLAAAAHRDVVALDHGVLAVVRDGVEVEVERAAGEERRPSARAGARPPRAWWSCVIDPRGILGEVALLGDGIEPGEQRQALVGHQRHDVALALDGPELEGQGRRAGRGRPGSSWSRAGARPGPARRGQADQLRARTGTSPPQRVWNRRGASENARTSATGSTVGRGRAGRSSSRRRGSGAKPSALSTSRTAVGLRASCRSLSVSLIS